MSTKHPSQPVQGYLLTSNAEDVANHCYLRFFAVTDMGRVEVIITDFKPFFYVDSEGLQFLADRQLDFSSGDSPADLKSFDGSQVFRVCFQSLKRQRDARSLLEKHSLRCFEADVKACERYLMERGIHARICLKSPTRQRSRGVLIQWIDPEMKASSESWQPALSSVSLDIETGKKGELLCIGLHFKEELLQTSSERKLVLMTRPLSDDVIPHTALDESMDVSHFRDERSMLQSLVQFTHVFDPDLLIGWNVVGFDFDFILKKMSQYGLQPLLGRNQSPLEIYKGRMGARTHLNGRVILDVPQLMRTNFYDLERYGLDSVAQKYLGDGKLIASNDDKWDEIVRLYREDYLALAAYNIQDAVLVTKILEKSALLELLLARSMISGLLLAKVGGSTAAFDHVMLPYLLQFGFVAPNVSDIDYDRPATGGFVFSPEAGIYQDVLVLDFKSLYPSIIRTFKIDPISRLLRSEDPLQTPVGISFSRTKHALPGIIEKLLDERAKAKDQGNAQLSQAVKILMNSFYGVMGSSGCRFYHPDLPEAITGSGRAILQKSKEILNKLGLTVIYGDTDSVFVLRPTQDHHDYQSGEQIATALNQKLDQWLLRDFGVKSELEIEFEKHYTQFFLPPLRGHSSGSKKRYAGLLLKGNTETLLFTGLEYVRSDWTLLAKNFQYELYRRIFHQESFEDWIRKFVRELRDGLFDDQLVYKKRLTKNIEKYDKTTPPHVKAAKILKSKNPRQSLRRIHYLMTIDGPQPVKYVMAKVDYEHYVEKQLQPIADAILPFVGSNFTGILDSTARERLLFTEQD